jgi:pimeloyl-ACP methyl ester carboxylesterase
MATVRANGRDFYYEESGSGVPILLIHPSGATASTWGAVVDEAARVGRVIAYDRRGYARTGGPVVHSAATHTADAAAILDALATQPAVVVGTSSGATIAIDVAVRRPDLVRIAIAHEAPWRAIRRRLTAAQVMALAKIGTLSLLRRPADAADVLLRFAYTYRDGSSAWDLMPDEWRRIGREEARPALADFRAVIGEYPSAADLSRVVVPVVCTYGERSPLFMPGYVRSLAAAMPGGIARRIDGAGHAAPFDATANFVQVIADAAVGDHPRALRSDAGKAAARYTATSGAVSSGTRMA